MKLEKSGIDPLTCPPGQRDKLFFDDELKGFGLRVTAKGAKTWLVQYRHPVDGAKRVVLGRYPELTPHKARLMATKVRAAVIVGGDPAGDRKQAREQVKRAAAADVLTLRTLIARWETTALRDRRESYRTEAVRALSKAFPNYLDKSAESLVASSIQLALDATAENHATMARRILAYGRAAFAWALTRQLVETNPFASVVVDGREVSRDRVLSQVELGEAWRAAGALPAVPQAFVRLAILTLQRRGEIAGMRWDELSGDCSLWVVPASRAKNGRSHLVHLAEPARVILTTLARKPTSKFVFETFSRVSKGSAVAISGFSAIQRQLIALILTERKKAESAKTGLSAIQLKVDWRLHDFRRTGVTAMAQGGIAPHVADRILNHVEGTISGVAAIYQRHDFLDERRQALEFWCGQVLRSAVS